VCLACAVAEDLPAIPRRVAAGRGQDATCRQPETEAGETAECGQRSRRRQIRSQPPIPEFRKTLRKGDLWPSKLLASPGTCPSVNLNPH